MDDRDIEDELSLAHEESLGLSKMWQKISQNNIDLQRENNALKSKIISLEYNLELMRSLLFKKQS